MLPFYRVRRRRTNARMLDARWLPAVWPADGVSLVQAQGWSCSGRCLGEYAPALDGILQALEALTRIPGEGPREDRHEDAS